MDQVRLVEFVEGDCAELVQWVNDEGERLFWQWGGGAVFRYPLDEAQLLANLRTARGENPVRRPFRALDAAGRMIGYLELNRIDRQSRSAVVSRVLVGRAAGRGKGIGSQMVGALMAIAFGGMGLQSLTRGVFSFNQGAIRCYEALGFERYSEREVPVLGEMWTSIQMQLGRERWENQKGM